MELGDSGKLEQGIVIYDSKFGNTEKVARSLADGLKMAGVATICVSTNEVQAETLKSCDLIAIGAPTQMFTASKPMKDSLVKLENVPGLRGKHGFAFDTKFNGRLSGSASKFIEKKMEDLGFELVRPRQSAIVDKTEGPLEDGALETFEQIGFDIGNLLTRSAAAPA